MTLSEASVYKVGNRWTDDSRGEVKVFLAATPIDNFLFLIDKRKELGLIVWIESPIWEVFRDKPWELD